MFQSLIGKIQTYLNPRHSFANSPFQSLIGKIQTLDCALRIWKDRKFQSIIGKIQTDEELDFEDLEFLFQSLIGKIQTILKDVYYHGETKFQSLIGKIQTRFFVDISMFSKNWNLCIFIIFHLKILFNRFWKRWYARLLRHWRIKIIMSSVPGGFCTIGGRRHLYT